MTSRGVLSLVLSLMVLQKAAADTCTNPSLPCMNTQCMPPEVCINIGSATDETCCDPNDIVPDAPPPPPPVVDTTTATPTVPVTVPSPTVTAPSPSTCVDKINPSTGTSDCTKMAAYCTNSAYYALMTDQCPKTCGRCTGTATPSPSTCVDKVNPSTGVSDCTKNAALCSNSAYYALMTDQCPKTCGRCSGTTSPPSTTCVDKVNPTTGVSDCSKNAALCSNSAYYALMTEQCPKTCGRCSGTTNPSPPTTTCVDLVNPTTGVSDCTKNAALCNNSAYYTLMTQQCPRTCGRCSG